MEVPSPPPIPMSADVLTAIVHGQATHLGGACWSLADLDEVHIEGGTDRTARRMDGVTRMLAVTIPSGGPGRQARLCRSDEGWAVVNEGAGDRTLVDGLRIDRHELSVGERIECSGTLFLFDHASRAADVAYDPWAFVPTVTPSVDELNEELARIAEGDDAVLLMGESGTGKTHLAEAIHRVGSEATPRSIDVAALGEEDEERVTSLAASATGTLIVEQIDQLARADAAVLGRVLDRTSARVIATSRRPYLSLRALLPPELVSRVAEQRVELPPLRDRPGDLGAWIATLLEDPPAMTPHAVAALSSHRWPGNLTELAMVLRTAALVAGDGPIGLDHLPAEVRAVGQ